MRDKIQNIVTQAVAGTKDLTESIDELLALSNTDNRTPEDRCKEEGHNMFQVYHLNNFDMGGSSHWGLNKCSRCGHEEPWQYDF